MAKKKAAGKRKMDPFSGFQRDKKKLKTPFTVVSEKSPGVWRKSTWHDVQMPEYLWVALILSGFTTEDAIARLREIGQQWPSMTEQEHREVHPVIVHTPTQFGQNCSSRRRQFRAEMGHVARSDHGRTDCSSNS